MLMGLHDLVDAMDEDRRVGMIEIGSYAGESAAIFASRFEHVTCVDPFLAVEGQPLGRGIVEGMFDARLYGFRNVVKVVMASGPAAHFFEAGRFDMVYIDADHTEEAVINQIADYLPKIRKGGYIGGHDYNMGQVRKAFDTMMPIYGCVKVGEFCDHSVLFRLP